MNHFLIKNSLTIRGAGGKPSSPPPPIVTQFPSVLAPPQFGQFNSINSFSYAEMIDLLADGPIEGLINKNGRKVYDENIFEGIYLNDTPIKETSSIENQYIAIGFLKNALKKLWALPLSNLQSTLVLDHKNVKDIDDSNFSSNISLSYYHPDVSVAKFVSLMRGDINSSLLINRAFDLVPIKAQRPFLTVIEIPYFNIFLDKNRFDSSEGGYLSPAPLKLGISNISEHFYFDVGYDSLNLFNYFELPRSFVINDSQTPSNKKTFDKTQIENPLYLQYEVKNLKIVIWSIYDMELEKPKNFDIALDRYFKNFIVFQNKSSLFNYNLVSSEFRSGSELQIPLNGFNKTEMDIEIGKELIGPFKITNNFNPTNAFGAGGVQRLNSLCLLPGVSPPTNLDLSQETSDDIRFIKNWSIGQTNQNGDPFVINQVKTNYSQFDRTSTNRVSSKATPVTHYISNQNVEEVYLTLSLSQLSDTNHVELICSTNSTLSKKYLNTDGTPPGVPTYAQLPGIESVSSANLCSKYLFLYGTSPADSKILAGSNTISGLFNTISCSTLGIRAYSSSELNSANLYYECWKKENLTISASYINNPSVGTPTDTANAYQSIFFGLCMKGLSAFNCYMLPTSNCFLISTICTKAYFPDPVSFENLLKTKDVNGLLKYDFALDDVEKVATTNYFNLSSLPPVDPKTLNFHVIEASYTKASDYETPECIAFYGKDFPEKIRMYQRCNALKTLNLDAAKYSNQKFMIATFDYYAPSSQNIEIDHIVAAVINDLIPYEEIFSDWVVADGPFGRYVNAFKTTQIKILIDINRYPFINKFIIEPFIRNATLTISDNIFNNTTGLLEKFNYYNLVIGQTGNSYTSYDKGKLATGWLFLLSVNFDYLYSVASFWKANRRGIQLNLDSVESLLSAYGYASDVPDGNRFSGSVGSLIKQTNIVTVNKLEEALKKININLIGGNDLYYFSINSSTNRFYLPWYTREQSLSDKNLYNITSADPVNTEAKLLSGYTSVKTTTIGASPQTVYYDPNVVYLVDKTKNNIALGVKLEGLLTPLKRGPSYSQLDYREVIIQYGLVKKSQINNTTNTLRSSAQYGTFKDGNLTANNFSTAVQSLAAGAKMPAVVSVKVETGYEGQEQEQKFNTDEYFAYQYDIYGLASEQALIDIGRVSQDYVYSKKINSDTGGYFQNIKNEYLYGNKLYLFRVTYKKNGAITTYSYFDDKFKNLGGLTPALTKADFVASGNISVINGGSPSTSIGLRQTIGGTLGGIIPVQMDLNDTFDELAYFWKTNDNFYSLNGAQLTDFFTDSYKTLVFSKALSFLKRVSNSKSLVPVNSYPSDSYVAASPISGNSNGFDRYEIYVDDYTYLSIDVYPFNYTIYNSIDTSSGLVVPINTSVLAKNYIENNLYLTLYYETKVANIDLAAALQTAFPEDLIYILTRTKTETIIARFSRTQESSGLTIIDKVSDIGKGLGLNYTFAGNLALLVQNLFKF